MTVLTEAYRAGECVVRLAEGDRSKDACVVVSGQSLSANQVVGRVTITTPVAVAISSNTGDGAMGALTAGKDIQRGVYKLLVTEPGSNVGEFTLEAPDGTIVGSGVVATAFSSSHLSFTLADGATDFAAGDGFNIYTDALAAPTVSGTGNGTMSIVRHDLSAKRGVYTITCNTAAANGGVFTVADPDGTDLGDATVGTEFVGGGVRFTISDGSTDFIVGDVFTFTVAAGKAKAWSASATDGSSEVYGILWDDVDASTADANGVAIVRDAEVNGAELVFASGTAIGAQQDAKAALTALGVIVR